MLVFTKSTYEGLLLSVDDLHRRSTLVTPENEAELFKDDNSEGPVLRRDTNDGLMRGTQYDVYFWVCDSNTVDPLEGDNVLFTDTWSYGYYGDLDEVEYLLYIDP
jgi:hypothetical protein